MRSEIVNPTIEDVLCTGKRCIQQCMCTEKRPHPLNSFKLVPYTPLHTQRTWHFDGASGAPGTLSQLGNNAWTFEVVDQFLYIRYLVQAGIEIVP